MFINKIEYYIPKDTKSLDLLYEEMQKSLSSIYEDSTAFKEFYSNYTLTNEIRVEYEKSKTEMYEYVLSNLVDDSIKSKVKYIIIADDYRTRYESIGHYLQFKYDLSSSNILNISGNFCCNIDYSIMLAKKLLLDYNDESYVLILTGNIVEKNDLRIVGSYALLSDACGGMLISNVEKENSLTILDSVIHTNGKLYKMNMSEDNTISHYQSYKRSIDDLLKKNKIEPFQISNVLLHNANNILIKLVLKSLKIDNEHIVHTPYRHIGHFDTVDLIVNLSHVMDIERTDDFILSTSIGAPGTYFSSLFK